MLTRLAVEHLLGTLRPLPSHALCRERSERREKMYVVSATLLPGLFAYLRTCLLTVDLLTYVVT